MATDRPRPLIRVHPRIFAAYQFTRACTHAQRPPRQRLRSNAVEFSDVVRLGSVDDMWGFRVRLNSANHQWGKDPPKEVVG
jgi:hypothetical protein